MSALSLTTFQSRRPALIRAALLLLVSITPVLVSLILVSTRKNVTDFYPIWNDEVSYWHQTLTFIETGFQGGYYTINELPPAGFSHYYVHGPWYPMLYAGLSRLVGGWHYNTALILNSLLLAAALLAYCISTRLSNRHLIAAGLLLATFWPFQLYLFSGMQEILHQLIAVIGALAFYHLIRLDGRISRRAWVAILIFLSIAVLLRLSWAILLPPFFWLTSRRGWRGLVLTLLGTMLLTGVIGAFSSYIGAPGNNSIFRLLGNFGVSIPHGITTLWEYFYYNLTVYLNLGRKQPLDSLLTVQVIALIAGALAVIGVVLWRRTPPSTSDAQVGAQGLAPSLTILPEASFHAFNLVAIVGSSLALYIIATWGDYKVICTHVMLSLLLMLAFKRYIPIAFMVITNLLLVTAFLGTYREMVITKFPDYVPPELVEFSPVAAQHMAYDPAADNPWCNAVLHDVPHYDVALLAVPAGIGFSLFDEPSRVALPIKSYYVLLNDDMLARFQQFEPPPNLEAIAQTSRYTLYINHDADCPTRQGE